MASPPVISAPTLVTSTNQVACNTASSPCSTTPPSSPQKDDWHFKYLEAKANYRKLKSQMREQAKKSRQLIVAVKNKLQEEDNDKIKMRSQYEQELSGLCQQLLSLQAAMLREQIRVKTVIYEKDQIISQQKQEMEKLLQTSPAIIATPTTNIPPASPSPITSSNSSNSVSVTSLSGLSPVALGGSLRIHGSFRQYKKDREKIRQQLKSTSDSSSSSGININSSEESSSASPSTLPRTQKTREITCVAPGLEKNSSQKGTLRQTLSSSAVENQTMTTTMTSISNKKKGILKASSSIDSPANAKEVLTNLDQLIDQLPSQNKSSSSTKIQINPEDKSDSGRESDDMIQVQNNNNTQPPQLPNVSVVTVSSTTDCSSANSSFDGSDPTLSWKINVKSHNKKEPLQTDPPNPPSSLPAKKNPHQSEILRKQNTKPEVKADDDCLDTKEEVIDQKQGLTEAKNEVTQTPTTTTKTKHINKKEIPSEQQQQPVISTLNKKIKPPPPPRSSQTRLSTIIKPKSILSPKNSLNTEISPTEALDNLIRNPATKLRQSEKKKRVKFNPRIDTSTASATSIAAATSVDQSNINNNNNKASSSKPLDPNFLHFLPRLNQKQQQEMAKKGNGNAEIIMNDNVNNKNFSYYEPYI